MEGTDAARERSKVLWPNPLRIVLTNATQVEVYDLGVLSLEYKESKTLYDITKAEKEVLNARFEHLRSRNRPMMDLKE